MTSTLYGIPNCDTVKKARVWLDQHGRAFTFHDYKKAGIDRASLEGWVAEHGWEVVLNRAGTTFRALDTADKDGLDAEKAIGLMLALRCCLYLLLHRRPPTIRRLYATPSH